MPSMLGGLVKARLGHVEGEMQGEQIQQQKAAQEAKARQEQERMMMERALNEMKLEQGQRELAQPQAPRNIDPLSPEGIKAAIEREKGLVGVRPPRATAGASGGQGGRSDGPPKLTEGERRGGALLTMAEDAAKALENATAPSRTAAVASKFGMNEALSADRQSQIANASQLVSSYLYLMSGATATDDEIKRRAEELIPQAGDKPEVVAAKAQKRQVMLKAMRTAAGNGASLVPTAAPQTPPDEIEAAYQEALSMGMPLAKADQLRAQAIARKQGKR